MRFAEVLSGVLSGRLEAVPEVTLLGGLIVSWF